MLLAQMKAQNSSNKFKNESRQILYSLYQHFIIWEENMIVIKYLKTFCYKFVGKMMLMKIRTMKLNL